jgi:CheY-like chemotaxis protein
MTRVRARVLVADDEPAVRRVAERVLGREYDVTAVDDGDSVLEQLAARPGFALVLLDSAMPRMSGQRVLELMRERGDATPVVICSGYGDDAGTDAQAFPNLRGYLAKPYTLAQLLACVAAQLGAP